MWVTAKECAGAVGLPTDPNNVRARLDSLSNTETKRKREGTKAFEYQVSILPPATQAAIFKKLGKVQVGDQVVSLPKKQPKQNKTYCREALWARWDRTNNKAKEKAQQALVTVKAVYALQNNGIKLMDAYDSVSQEYGVALSTLRRNVAKVKDINECDWAPALLPKHLEAKQAGKNKQFAYITPEAWDHFKGDYLRLEGPVFSVCYERLKDTAKHRGWVIPSSKSLSRRLNYEVPHPHQVLFREGEHALHQLYPPQRRSVQHFHALEWINGDGYQHNVFVKWFNGEIIRPKTWFWQDVYSRKIIGWRCDISENTDSIRLSFMDVCKNYGIPGSVTIDNTRAAANKWMTGGVPNRYRFKVQDDEPLGIIPMMIGKENLHWTSVILGKGHGQAKPIERAFGVGGLEEYIDKHPSLAGAYTGPNPMAKPDNYGSKAIDAEVFLKAIAKGVEMYNAKENRQTEICQGFMSFNQAFNASYESATIRKATKEQIHMMMLASEAVSVNKHGSIEPKAGKTAQGRGNRYFNERLLDFIGKKVVVRFDPMNLHSSVEIYTLNGVRICTAEIFDDSGFNNTKDAREQKRKRTQFVKNTKLAAEAQKAVDALEVAAMMKDAEEDVIPETKTVELFRPTAIGNVAVKAQAIEDEDEDYEANFQNNLASFMEQRKKNQL